MTTFINTAEIGLADETAVTTANSGGGTGNFAFVVETNTTGAVKVDSAQHHRGTYAFRFDCPSSTDYARGVVTLSGSTSTCIEAYFQWNGLPTVGSSRFIHIISPSSGTAVYVQMATTGKFEVFDNAGVRIYLSTTTITPGVWYRVSFGVVVGTTTSNGTLRFQFSSGANLETNTPDESHAINAGITTSNTGTIPFTSIRFGHSTTQNRPSLWADDVQYSDSSSAIIGAPSSGGATPINSWTVTDQRIVDASATSGTPTSQTLTQTSGPTVTITGPVAGKFTVVLPAGMSSNAILSLVSTNATGTDTDSITITPTGGSGTTIIRDFKVWTSSGLQ